VKQREDRPKRQSDQSKTVPHDKQDIEASTPVQSVISDVYLTKNVPLQCEQRDENAFENNLLKHKKY